MKHYLERLSVSVLQSANHDFCPNLNRYVYWLKQPFGWCIVAILFSLLVGLSVGPQGYVLASVFLALLVLGTAWPWLSMKGIHCSLALPSGAMKENEPGQFVLGVRNNWPIPVFGVTVEGDFLQGFDPDDDPIAFSLKRIPAFSKTEFPVAITPRRRGVLPAGEVRICNGFPFGLAAVSKPVAEIATTLVWPECETLQGSPPADGSLFNIAGALADRAGNDGESIGIRCYREGDRLRNIHWAQTSRSQKLMVRERQTPSSAISTVLLDLCPDHHSGRGVDSSFEWSIRIAASICFQLHRTNASFRVVCLGLPRNVPHTKGNARGIEPVMRFLASLPTLKMQRESSDLIPKNRPNPSLSNQTFFVCTSDSPVMNSAGARIEQIVIELNGFADSHSELRNGKENRPEKHRHGGFLVTAPRLAASQLEVAWRRSFGHAAG
ncbi:DUF58 domain-containing protein [Mariniblastus fucicola]|uniref:DUF58 domain-containing protein n=1 Tax=Mariniblastus fucicola TaxID=980251 RepID=A0A5B9PEL9_9BACT|nr:DUF58 domain-containing protein [Mariniblastus fucicola]QEG23949.1 hypothetical protein MFFC18_38540 [Mariniblastus fucicola]